MSASSSFKINPTSGAVSIATEIDVETMPSSYTIEIEASDGLNPAVTDDFIVTIQDVNDNPHSFLSSGEYYSLNYY